MRFTYYNLYPLSKKKLCYDSLCLRRCTTTTRFHRVCEIGVTHPATSVNNVLSLSGDVDQANPQVFWLGVPCHLLAFYLSAHNGERSYINGAALSVRCAVFKQILRFFGLLSGVLSLGGLLLTNFFLPRRYPISLYRGLPWFRGFHSIYHLGLRPGLENCF